MNRRDPHDSTGRREADAAVQLAWHTERVAVLASVSRRLGDLQLAEDAVQEAFAAATIRWVTDGVPERPGAWLSTTAWRKAIDRLRRDRFPVTHHRTGTETGTTPPDVGEPAAIDARLEDDLVDPVVRHDDVLSLVLACCHPALNPEAQIALTLRHVVGLTDRQIAARFLIPEPTMTKRLVRARAKIRDARISFALPDRTRLHERLDEVRTVIYLIFTEGYLTTDTEAPIRAALCDEALWLARQLHRLAPDPETTGLLALLLLQHARTTARQDDTGRLIPYAEQDRGQWDTTAITEAKTLLATTTAPAAAQPGPYQLQAAIALLHATAPADSEPRWTLIADLYAALERIAPSPVVTINHAVALGRAGNPHAGLHLLAPVLTDPRLHDYLPLRAAHADLLQHTGAPCAAAAWRHAADLATNPHQQAALLRRATALSQTH